MTIEDKLNRRTFLKALAICGAIALFPEELLAADGISSYLNQKPFVNGNHAFITVARKGQYRADVVTAEELTGRTDDFATTKFVRDKTGAQVVFNGSLFEGRDAASGLEVHNGVEKKPYDKRVGDGVLYVNGNGEIRIVPVEFFMKNFKVSNNKYNVTDALQLNLLRYYNDEIKYTPNVNETKVPRNLIGLTQNGDLVEVVFKNTNFTLGDMYMRTQHRCVVVGALDGYTSASAFGLGRNESGKFGFISSQKKSDKLPELQVPNFIVLYNR